MAPGKILISFIPHTCRPETRVKMEAIDCMSKFKVIIKANKLLSKCDLYSFLDKVAS